MSRWLALCAAVANLAAAAPLATITPAQETAVRAEFRKLSSAEVESRPARGLPKDASVARIDVSEHIRSASFGHRTTLLVRVEGGAPKEFWVEYERSTNHASRLFGPFKL